MKTNAYAFIIALLCLFIAGNANAITGTCGMVINNPGEYILENDITRCSGGGGYGVKYAIKIQADNVRLDLNGHTISGTGSAYGIYVAGSSFVTIAGPGRIENFNTGISIECRYDSGTGTSYSSNHNTIENLTISGNTFGISFDWAHSGLTYTGNSIDNNTILSNSQIGIYLSDSVDSTISNNIVSGGYYGIVLTNSSGNTIKLNRVTENTYGILLIVASSNNEIYENAICSNREYGLDLACDAHNNHIYHNNFIDNVKHAADFDYDHKSNRWEYNYFSGHDCGQCIFSSYCSNPFTIPCRAQSKDNTPLCEPWPDAPSCGMEERKGSICGFKFHDVNGDGEWTISSEPGISGWEIRLEGPDGMSAMAVTGPDGSYCFTDLPSGIYTVRETLKEEWVQTYPAIPGSHVINLEEGESVCGVNFGNSLTQLTGKIIIQKMTLPPDDQTSFNFIGNGLTPESFSLKDGESKVFDNVQAG
ncbi:hypothetical protein FJZ33_10495, partial [Candidatus Poribacteria bacterium]|nr:hypothetical protein [Candidatus Poribacteria bacterium]